MIRELLAEGAENGNIRDDVAPDELATYRLHAFQRGQHPAVQGGDPAARKRDRGRATPPRLSERTRMRSVTVVLMYHGVALATTNHRPVDREGERPGDDEASEQRRPKA